MNYIEDKDGWVICSWRNINEREIDIEHVDQMLCDAPRMDEFQFKLMYGRDAYRYFAPDNSIRVATNWRHGKLKFAPLQRSVSISHTNDPRKGENVLIEKANGEKLYGKIVYVRREDDEVGIFMFLDKTTDTWPTDLLESVTAMGSVRWKICI